MKKWKVGMLGILLTAVVLSGCGRKTEQEAGFEQAQTETDLERSRGMFLEFGEDRFEVELYANETVEALTERLPMTLRMEELNGNEKYYYLDESLPADSEAVGNIQAGDIMLYGSDCLVVFFESFSTPYSYTRIGHIEDVEGFTSVLPAGTVEISFGIQEEK